MIRFFSWVRKNSQKYLLEAVQTDLAAEYLGRGGPVNRPSPAVFFWRRIFAPLYRRLPWVIRHKMILMMPGSNRRQWDQPPT